MLGYETVLPASWDIARFVPEQIFRTCLLSYFDVRPQPTSPPWLRKLFLLPLTLEVTRHASDS